MKMYDAIVVGAGPAGSVAATVLAKLGCRVLLLDKATFPRDKVCGDSIGRGSIHLLSRLGLPLALEPEKWNCYPIEKLKFVSPSGSFFETAFWQKDSFPSQSYLMPRMEFDRILWEFALQQGAEFERLSVTEPIMERGVICGVRGKINEEFVERYAKITIAADGAQSVVTRFLHPLRAARKHYGVAMRAYIKGVQNLDHCIEFYFFDDVKGYAWVFPLGNESANVGIGFRLDLLAKSAKSLGQEFEKFIHRLRVAQRISHSAPIEGRKGGLLTFASHPLQRAYSGALLVGDAGAFVSSLTGEGISNALKTGQIAAEVAFDAIQNNDWSLDELRKFEVRWQNAIGKRLRVETVLQTLLGWPGALDLLVRQMSHNERFARFILSKF